MISAAGRLDNEVKTTLEGTKEAGDTPGLETLQGRVESLYESIGQADVAPTAIQIDAARSTRMNLRAALDRWNEIAPRVKSLNRSLRSAGLAEIDPERGPSSDAVHRNEE